jgi:hypothetical protein
LLEKRPARKKCQHAQFVTVATEDFQHVAIPPITLAVRHRHGKDRALAQVKGAHLG